MRAILLLLLLLLGSLYYVLYFGQLEIQGVKSVERVPLQSRVIVLLLLLVGERGEGSRRILVGIKEALVVLLGGADFQNLGAVLEALDSVGIDLDDGRRRKRFVIFRGGGGGSRGTGRGR